MCDENQWMKHHQRLPTYSIFKSVSYSNLGSRHLWRLLLSSFHILSTPTRIVSRVLIFKVRNFQLFHKFGLRKCKGGTSQCSYQFLEVHIKILTLYPVELQSLTHVFSTQLNSNSTNYTSSDPTLPSQALNSSTQSSYVALKLSYLKSWTLLGSLFQNWTVCSSCLQTRALYHWTLFLKPSSTDTLTLTYQSSCYYTSWSLVLNLHVVLHRLCYLI